MMRNQGKGLILVAGVALLALLSACGGAVAEPVAAEPTAVVSVPEDMVTAREGVLDFLRTSANQCVPPEGAGWRSEPGGANTPEGYDVYRFYSDACVMTISHPQASAEQNLYHVAIGDTLTGFCWQAIVDANGQIVATGMEAQSIPGLGNPAAQYCEEQGYTFDIINRDSGGQCGVCIFPDGSMCNVWGYFHGVCGPGDFPASGE
jgi:putative hemolysin